MESPGSTSQHSEPLWAQHHMHRPDTILSGARLLLVILPVSAKPSPATLEPQLQSQGAAERQAQPVLSPTRAGTSHTVRECTSQHMVRAARRPQEMQLIPLGQRRRHLQGSTKWLWLCPTHLPAVTPLISTTGHLPTPHSGLPPIFKHRSHKKFRWLSWQSLGRVSRGWWGTASRTVAKAEEEEGERLVQLQHSLAMSLCALHNPYGISKDHKMGVTVQSITGDSLQTAAQSTALVRSQDNPKHLRAHWTNTHYLLKPNLGAIKWQLMVLLQFSNHRIKFLSDALQASPSSSASISSSGRETLCSSISRATKSLFSEAQQGCHSASR